MEDNKKIKKVIVLLAVLLGISVVALGGAVLGQYIDASKPVIAEVGDENNSSESEPPQITPSDDEGNFAITGENAERTKTALYRGHSEDKKTFIIEDMSPGDKKYEGYELKVNYSGTIVVRFKADVTVDEKVGGGAADKKLADVLMVRINIEGNTVYEGTLGKMPKEITHTLTSKEKTSECVDYDIYAWLPSGVGSDYSHRHLEAELCWWVAESEAGGSYSGQLEEIPDTGAPTPIGTLAAMAAVSLAGIIAFGSGKKRART